jgi:hypothetical protein
VVQLEVREAGGQLAVVDLGRDALSDQVVPPVARRVPPK